MPCFVPLPIRPSTRSTVIGRSRSYRDPCDCQRVKACDVRVHHEVIHMVRGSKLGCFSLHIHVLCTFLPPPPRLVHPDRPGAVPARPSSAFEWSSLSASYSLASDAERRVATRDGANSPDSWLRSHNPDTPCMAYLYIH